MFNPLIVKSACALVLASALSACGGGSATANVNTDPDTGETTITVTPGTGSNNGGSDSGNTSGTDAGNSGSTDSSNSGNTGGVDAGNSGDTGSGNTGGSDTGNTGGTESGNTGGSDAGTIGGGESGGVDSNDSDNNDNNDAGSSDGNASDNTDSGDSDSTDSVETTAPDSGYAAWDAGQTYNGGDRVSYASAVYEAKWWTQGDVPADNTGDGKVWKLIEGEATGAQPTEENDTDAGADESATGNQDQNCEENTVTDSGSRPEGMVVGTYFVEWGVYGRNYHVMDMPAEKLTHVLYGFIPICGPNDSLQQANASGYSALVQQCAGKQDYEVTIHDKYAALEKSYPGDKWDDEIKGNFGQLIKLKQQQPHLKVLPSIGGWTLSDPFFHLATDDNKRAVFVNSVANFLRTYSFFDGVDIDWEFPGGRGANANLGSQADYEAYADLMRDLRAMLDNLETELGKELELSSAIGTSPVMVAAANYGRAHQYMDYIFAMTYDYYGAWSGVLGHQTALNNYSYNTNNGFYAASVLDSLTAQNVPANKIVMGVAAYGRGWKNVSGGQPEWPFSGTGNGAAKGTWEDGVLDYKDIVANYLGGTTGNGINGFSYFYDSEAEAPYLWNYSTGTLITYDNPRSIKAKADFVKNHGLAGLFSWEIDADNGDITNAMVEGLSQ